MFQTDISFAFRQFYYATRNDTWLKSIGIPVVMGVAEFWASRVAKVIGDGGQDIYIINKVIPPGMYCHLSPPLPPSPTTHIPNWETTDESAGVVDNSIFTNVICSLSLQYAIEVGTYILFPLPLFI